MKFKNLVLHFEILKIIININMRISNTFEKSVLKYDSYSYFK